jgi:hypothetical protein
MTANEEEQSGTHPEWSPRLPDGGPRYTETPLDPRAPDAPLVAEPWNAVTASFFIFIVAAWTWRLRGRYRFYPFLCCCLPVLLAGGIGGTIYHATRISRFFFLLDLVPISLLGLAGAAYIAVRYWGRERWWLVPAFALFYIAANGLFFRIIRPVDRVWAVNLSYASLAVVVLTPIGLLLLRMRFRHGGWVVAGTISFVIAWFFRLVDLDMATYLRMGSHWLWHSFGAISTALMIEYFYLVEGEKVIERPVPPESDSSR